MSLQTKSRAMLEDTNYREPAKRTTKADESSLAKEHRVFPLLALPPEIRMMVIERYFGSRTIHIMREKYTTASMRGTQMSFSVRLDHRVCIVDSKNSRSRQTDEVQNGLLAGSTVEHGEVHADCNPMGHRLSVGVCPVPKRLNIDLLFVNKQIHQEAIKILYGKQTFSSNEPDDFAMFCHAMMQTQKPGLRKVELVTEAWFLKREAAHE